MGDSDDEFDRRGRGRDKFRGERNEFQRRDDRRGWEENKRENWGNRERNFRDDNYRGRRYSPQRANDNSPPQKRMRRDWDEGSHDNHEYSGSGRGGGSSWSGGGSGDMPPPHQGGGAAHKRYSGGGTDRNYGRWEAPPPRSRSPYHYSSYQDDYPAPRQQQYNRRRSPSPYASRRQRSPSPYYDNRRQSYEGGGYKKHYPSPSGSRSYSRDDSYSRRDYPPAGGRGGYKPRGGPRGRRAVPRFERHKEPGVVMFAEGEEDPEEISANALEKVFELLGSAFQKKAPATEEESKEAEKEEKEGDEKASKEEKVDESNEEGKEEKKEEEGEVDKEEEAGEEDEKKEEGTEEKEEKETKEKSEDKEESKVENGEKEEAKEAEAGPSRKDARGVGLPPCQDFADFFESYQEELKGMVCHIGQMLPLPKIAENSYYIRSCPWNHDSVPNPEYILDSAFFPHSSPPPLRIEGRVMAGWESSNRRMLGMLSNTSWYVRSVEKLLQKFRDEHVGEEGEEVKKEAMSNEMKSAQGMLNSIGLCLKDMGKLTSYMIYQQVLKRRESWIDQMDPLLPYKFKRMFWHSNVNNANLFDPDLAEQADRAVKQRRRGGGAWRGGGDNRGSTRGTYRGRGAGRDYRTGGTYRGRGSSRGYTGRGRGGRGRGGHKEEGREKKEGEQEVEEGEHAEDDEEGDFVELDNYDGEEDEGEEYQEEMEEGGGEEVAEEPSKE